LILWPIFVSSTDSEAVKMELQNLGDGPWSKCKTGGRYLGDIMVMYWDIGNITVI